MRLRKFKAWRFVPVAAFGNGCTAYFEQPQEAPLLQRSMADNSDVYAFRSPNDTNKVTIICTYVPGQLPFGGQLLPVLGKTSVMKFTSTTHCYNG